MDEKIYPANLSSLGSEEEAIGFSRIVEHAVGNTMAEVVPALESVLRLGNLSLALFEMVYRAELRARDLSAKVNALAELFGTEDAVSRLRMASYEIESFFLAFTEHLNQSLGEKLKGDISFSLVEGSEASVTFDARRISIILYHLISNALRHGRTENKNIKLLCRAMPGRFELAVRDYGGGVPEEVQPKLFSKFHEEFSLEHQRLGILPPRLQGLGLPLCRKLAQDMGGKLEFKNYVTGAKFTLVLPQAENRMREFSVFYPDDALLQSCMASLLLQLEEEDN